MLFHKLVFTLLLVIACLHPLPLGPVYGRWWDFNDNCIVFLNIVNYSKIFIVLNTNF